MLMTCGALLSVIREAINLEAPLAKADDADVHEFMYHATAKKFVASIMKKGLQPQPNPQRQFSNFRGPLTFVMNTPEGASDMYEGGLGKPGKMAVFKIKKSALPPSVTFYYDEGSGNRGRWMGSMEEPPPIALCTPDVIPPNALELIYSDE